MIEPKPIDTDELCKELVAMAGFIDNAVVRKKIYSAVRQLQLLDELARDAVSESKKAALRRIRDDGE